jgi:hypothetical protein
VALDALDALQTTQGCVPLGTAAVIEPDVLDVGFHPRDPRRQIGEELRGSPGTLENGTVETLLLRSVQKPGNLWQNFGTDRQFVATSGWKGFSLVERASSDSFRVATKDGGRLRSDLNAEWAHSARCPRGGREW